MPNETPPEVDKVEAVDTPKAAAPARPKWIAPAWFFFGILVGMVGFAAYNALIVKPPQPRQRLSRLIRCRHARSGARWHAGRHRHVAGGQRPAAAAAARTARPTGGRQRCLHGACRQSAGQPGRQNYGDRVCRLSMTVLQALSRCPLDRAAQAYVDSGKSQSRLQAFGVFGAGICLGRAGGGVRGRSRQVLGISRLAL